MTAPVGALVSDAHIRSSVAGIRGLGRAGIWTAVAAPRPTAAGRWSRYARHYLRKPDVLDDPVGFAEEIGALARERGPLVVYPGREEAIDALLRADLPPEAVLPYPGREPVRIVRDKAGMGARASDAGFAVPATLDAGTAAELMSRPSLPSESVLKQPHPERRATLGGSLVFETEDELRARLRITPPDEPLLVQERIRAPVVSVAVVIGRAGQLHAAFQHDYLTMWPVRGGSVASGRSAPTEPALAEASRRFLADAGYWGLAEVELLRMPDRAVLIDVNTRYYGSMPLALACGVNLPAIWHAVAAGEDPGPPREYPAGVSYRWLEADVSAAAKGLPRRLLRVAPRPRAGAMWAADDPIPGGLLFAEAAAVRALARTGGR